MQLQNPRAQSNNNAPNSAQIKLVSKNAYNQHDLPASYSRGSGGPNHQMLNKDNSILEIAKMQNSNGSNSDTYQMHSIIGKDYLQSKGVGHADD